MDSLSALPRKSRRGSGSPLAGAPLLFLNLFAPIEFFRAVDTMAFAFETERERPNWVAEGASSSAISQAQGPFGQARLKAKR